MCAQSFAKNAGLYGERVGALHIVTSDPATTDRVKSQLSVLQRSEISNPPLHGARLVGLLCVRTFLPTILRRCDQVSLILNDPTLFAQWKEDIKTMAGRIIEMRKELHRLLTEELHTPGNWDHIVNQIGMFRYVSCEMLAQEKLNGYTT